MIDNETLEKVYSDIFEEKPPALKTGFHDIDCYLSNIDNFCLITIGGRPAMGKTCFMTNIMLNILEQNQKCLYFSLEMSAEQLIKRLLGTIGEVDSHLLKMPSEISKRTQSIEKIVKAIEKISKYDLTILDEMVTVENIIEQIEKDKPKFVFIDMLQLINVSNIKSHSESLEEIVLLLKKIAKDNNCIVFISSPLSRAVESRRDKRPMLSDLKECGVLANISDIVMLIYRDEYYKPYCSDDDYAINKGEAEIILAKNKYGPVGTIKLLFRSSIMKFFNPIKTDVF